MSLEVDPSANLIREALSNQFCSISRVKRSTRSHIIKCHKKVYGAIQSVWCYNVECCVWMGGCGGGWVWCGGGWVWCGGCVLWLV